MYKNNEQGDGHVRTRSLIKKVTRYDFSSQIINKWKSIVRVSHCFEILMERIIETISNSKNNDEFSTEITLLQEILGGVNKLIQDMNLEFNAFNVRVSKSFQGLLHVCAVISVALFYYNRYKMHFDKVILSMHKKKNDLRDRFVRMVVIEANDDENIANNLVKEFIEALQQSFNPKVKEIIRKTLEKKSAILNRYSIIKELDEEVDNATDEWLMKYILHPVSLITERFNQHWDEINKTIEHELNITMNAHLNILVEFFRIMEQVNTVLQRETTHSLTFIDDLFKLPSEHPNDNPSEKKICMATLLYQYLTGEPSSTNITTKSGIIYTVDPMWAKILNDVLKPSTPLKAIFCTMKNTFETYNISYLSVLIEKIINQKENTEKIFRDQMTNFMKHNVSITKEQRLIQISGCEALCPCCKRLCDVDHRLDNASPVGVGENRHRCQFGHQIRGMGGIRYEVTNEASIEWCENIKDNDPIIIRQGIRQTWKDFKNICTDWDFGDSRIPDNRKTPYTHIWNRIGKQLCQHYDNGMIFVIKNRPMVVNHFILLLDHSSSMYSNNDLLGQKLRSNNQTNLSPWQHLLKAVQEFIRVRNEKVCPSDCMTVIVFGTRAIRVYNREKLNQIGINRINTAICGRDTDFSAAFQAIIEIFDEIKKDATHGHLRQTIVFMTDGQPQIYPTNELEQLSTKYRSMIANFWTMGLGNYDRKILENVNTTMKGKFVDIRRPEDLPEAYAEIADFDATNLL